MGLVVAFLLGFACAAYVAAGFFVQVFIAEPDLEERTQGQEVSHFVWGILSWPAIVLDALL